MDDREKALEQLEDAVRAWDEDGGARDMDSHATHALRDRAMDVIDSFHSRTPDSAPLTDEEMDGIHPVVPDNDSAPDGVEGRDIEDMVLEEIAALADPSHLWHHPSPDGRCVRCGYDATDPEARKPCASPPDSDGEK